jgi:AAA+ superfamily predicted ATPase
MTSVSRAHILSPRNYSSLTMGDSPLIDSLRRAVADAPDDLPLLLHLSELLLDAGHGDEAVAHLASAIRLEPGSVAARSLMARALAPPAPAFGASPTSAGGPPPVGPPLAGPGPVADPVGMPDPPATSGPPAEPDPRREPDPVPEFDWRRAEEDLGHPTPPMFVHGDDPATPTVAAAEVDRSTLRLADVGGMAEVKARLEAAFLAPMRNPDLQRLYGKSLKGGLLLYGPPGCGKTFLARAVAGELGAGFVTVSLADVIDMYIGQSERNLHDVFELARRSAPCVVFLDEVDALGQKRTQLRHSGMRSTVNQLLHELDGVGDDNQGVFVLAATNAPWDVDAALRRPGRLDRTLLVLPPDGPAREEILRYHLRDRPIAGIDLRRLAKRTDGFSGADLAHLCDSATEQALIESARSGSVRLIQMSDIEAALADVRPSTAAWFESARNVALFANEGGQYDDLLAYMKKNRLA